MIGIWGMGGIGKTTLAKAIYNEFERSFEGRSFLENVREVIANQPMGLVRLQKQLLNDILKSEGPKKVDSVLKGIEMIRRRLPCKRALVIIDDADDLHQLEAIAGARDWFGPGSRILITTRNQHLLQQVGVDGTYIAEKMDEEEALEFFSWHAFKRRYPDQEYLDLSKRVIRYCQGLPLALRVVGSFLFNRSTAEWESHLEKLQTSPDGDIQKILRISFDGLPDDTTRKIFLDISCFFIGDDKDYVTKILDGCGFYATIGISVLIERCLVTLSKYNKLEMHDLLRDMGREIVYENADGRPEKFSRLWKHEDVTNVLNDESGTKKIEGVALRGSYRTRFSAQAFTNMKKLRLLRLSGVELTGEYKDFPKTLIWLCWCPFPLESIPDDFPVQPKLVALDLRWSKLKIVWKDCKLHQNLKILNLSHSYKLTKSPDFSKLPNLEELILGCCESLSEVHSSIGDLGRLSLVNLKDCIMLKDLPLNFYKSKSIETLLLTGCSRFEKLAEGLGDMVSLTTLEADQTSIRQIPSSISKLKKLKVLSLSCDENGLPLTNLWPPSLQSLSSLRELSLVGWAGAVPKDLGSLISLESLNLAGNDFCSLPSFSRLSKLHDLSLNKCKNLRAIPDLPTNLKVLQADGCIALEKMPDFSEMSNIRELFLSDSGKLTEIPGLCKSLNSMTRIHMEKCTKLTADFRKSILQGWTSCGYGGIFLSGNDIPDWFDCVHDDDIVYFTVPRSVGRNFKGLTLSFVYSSDENDSNCEYHSICISIKNVTKGSELEARIIPDCPIEGYYLWQGQLSNDELKLQEGDKVLIEIIPEHEWVKVKKTGVSLVSDKFMNENMIDYHLCAYERRPYLVNDDDIIRVEDDNHIRKSPDFSKFPNLKKLILKGCKELIKVHSSIGHLGRLSLVNLEGCSRLKDLPLNFYKSKSIETLILNDCWSFEKLAEGLGDMVSLTTLKADNTSIRQIPSSIVKLKKLRILSLSGCWRLTKDAIPKDLCSLISLEHLLLDARKAHKVSSSSSPSTSSSKRLKYDVFLSFRGEDTRKGFTGHLHAALSDAGFHTFLDDNELKRAEFIKTQLEQAIDGSMISIIVFSKWYADSSWCLDELVKIMECRERQQVFPLFYNIDASDVRKQTGSFAQAFEKHEAGICEGKHEKEKVQRWRKALTQAADLCGQDLKNADGHEAKFINKILGVVNELLDIKSQLDIKHPVGITSRVKALSNHLHIENSGSKDDVRMIGILGMGGIGKTTLAKAIYNEFERSFEGRSFLENVREVFANQRSNGLVGLQKQLLNDILKSKEPKKVGSVANGIDMIRARLPCKRALVIIDDADDLHQLEAIAGARDWFGPGSRILITTRNQHLLQQVGVDGTYIAEEMDEEEALEFFSWHAFKRRYPEYLDLSKRVIRYCQGLPLALRVVGSFLFNRSIAEWESHLEKLQTSPDGDIQKILRISFDGLDDTTRKIFLDISCFFIGDDKDYVTKILDGCGFYATIGISVLIERCLVTLSKYNKLGMHDLLRDMGRKIVYKNTRGHPEKFSRLWKREDVTDVLRDKSGTKKIEGVALHGFYGTRFSAQAFTNMKNLRLLRLSGVELTGEYKDFPKTLIWLCWHGFPLESIPDDFPTQPKLVALDLQRSKLKIVWKDCKLHQNLKILNLSHSRWLTKSPDFSKLPNLEELILKYCMSLSEVHSSIGDLGRLSLVNLKGCRMLKDLPLNFYKSKSIETLLLTGCSRFEDLADGLGDMVSLTILEADYTAIRQIPSLAGLSKLKVLCVNACENLRGIPDLPTNLYVLKANECPELETIPDFSKCGI